MTIRDIKSMPCVLDSGANGKRYHESIFRSFHMLKKVIEMLQAGTPASVVIDIVDDVEATPQIERPL